MSHRHRRYDSDDDDEGERSKRSRSDHEESLAKEKLEGLITKLGNNFTMDQHESLQNNLHGLASLLDGEIGKLREFIVDVLVSCAFERPDKMCIYTTLIGLLNLKNHSFVGELIERLVRLLREQLKSGNWEDALCCVRFLADLTNCGVLAPASLLQLYNAFVGVTLEDGIPQARSDYFVHCVLASLPWAASALAEKHKSELDALLHSIGTYRDRRSLGHVPAVQSLVNAEQLDYINSLWHQVKSMQKNEWKEKCIVRFEAFQPLFKAPEATQHSLPSIVPLPHEEGTWYPSPAVVFRLFDYTDVPEDGPALPGELSMERYLAEEQLLAAVSCSYGERRDCARALLNCRFGVKVPLHYIIVELLLGRVLRLPQPEHLLLFYNSLLIELCKEDAETMPNVVAQATLNLFDKLDTMNSLCVDRFVRWFSYHLAQCQYKWSWADWADALQLPSLHPKCAFLREMAQFLMRFSYYEHVKKMLAGSGGSPQYDRVLPSQPPDCVFKYDSEEMAELPAALAAKRLTERIRQRCTPEQAIEVLQELTEQDGDGAGAGDAGDGGKEKEEEEEEEAAMDAEEGESESKQQKQKQKQKSSDRFSELQIDVFFTTLFNLASKSFSHSFAALAKFDILCKALVPSDSPKAKARLLDTMHECWRWHEQMMVVLVDKMVKVQLLDCHTVVDWLLTRLDAEQLGRFYAWDIVDSTLGKMCKHAGKLADDCARAKRRYDAYQEHMKDGQQELDLEEDTPTREELEAKRTKAEAAEADLRGLLRTLLTRCFDRVVQAPDDDPNSPHLRKLVFERCLGVLVLHYRQVCGHLKQLQATLQLDGGQSQVLARSLFEKFFSLTD